MIYAGACRRGAGKGEGGSGAILRKAMQVCMYVHRRGAGKQFSKKQVLI